MSPGGGASRPSRAIPHAIVWPNPVILLKKKNVAPHLKNSPKLMPYFLMINKQQFVYLQMIKIE